MAANDPAELHALLAGARVPRRLDRAGRVALLVECVSALLAGRAPRAEAALFLGSALSGWLARGGSLERDFLQVTERGSHLTPQRLAALIGDEDNGLAPGVPSAPSSTDEGTPR